MCCILNYYSHPTINTVRFQPRSIQPFLLGRALVDVRLHSDLVRVTPFLPNPIMSSHHNLQRTIRTRHRLMLLLTKILFPGLECPYFFPLTNGYMRISCIKAGFFGVNIKLIFKFAFSPSIIK